MFRGENYSNEKKDSSVGNNGICEASRRVNTHIKQTQLI